MKRRPLNIVYQPGSHAPAESACFQLIWKVDADEGYEALHPEGLGDPGIFIVYEGCGSLATRQGSFSRKYLLSPSTFLLLDAGVPCSYRCAGNEGWRFHFIHFKSLSFPVELGLEANMVYPFREGNYIHMLSESIITEIIRRETGYLHQIDSLFSRLLVCLARQQVREAGETQDAIKRVIHWIHGNYDKRVDVEKLIELSSLSRSAFFREFKRVSGHTPHEFFMRVKLEAAKLMLKTTSLKITEIAHALGFYDEFHFSKSFNNRYSLSPSSYRSCTESDIL